MFRSPGNPNKHRQSKVRVFEGIGGMLLRVLKRFNARGWDISNTVSNEIIDFDLGEQGSMDVRNGARKINDTGRTASIDTLFMMNLGGIKRYGLVSNGVLDVIDIPEWSLLGQHPFTFSPLPAAVAAASVYPISYPGDPL